MQGVFKEAVALLEQGQPFVLARVVRTRGSTPQKPGAVLLVRRDGSIVGTLGGGCVEAEVWARCRDLLERGGGPLLSTFYLSDDLAAQSGMVCGGSMDIFIDPTAARQEFLPVAREIARAYEGGGSVALATAVSGPAPGTYLFLRESGARTGSLGSGGAPGRCRRRPRACSSRTARGRERPPRSPRPRWAGAATQSPGRWSSPAPSPRGGGRGRCRSGL